MRPSRARFERARLQPRRDAAKAKRALAPEGESAKTQSLTPALSNAGRDGIPIGRIRNTKCPSLVTTKTLEKFADRHAPDDRTVIQELMAECAGGSLRAIRRNCDSTNRPPVSTEWCPTENVQHLGLLE